VNSGSGAQILPLATSDRNEQAIIQASALTRLWDVTTAKAMLNDEVKRKAVRPEYNCFLNEKPSIFFFI